MKLYRNYANLAQGIMTAEDVLDKYLEYPHGLCTVGAITEKDAAVAILDERIAISPAVKAYLTRYVEDIIDSEYKYVPRDWQLAVDIITEGVNNDNKDK